VETGTPEKGELAGIPLTVPEIRKLWWQLAWRHVPILAGIIQWSLWRRRHQAIARACHYKRRGYSP
jgi:hypothetical protein